MGSRVSPREVTEMSESERKHQEATSQQPVNPGIFFVQSVNGQQIHSQVGTSANFQGQPMIATTSFNGGMIPQPVYVIARPPLSQAAQSASTCWFVAGILSAFCCFPLGIAGAVMAYMSGEDAKRGDAVSYKKKLCQAKALTSTGFGIAILTIIVTSVTIGVLVSSLGREGHNDYDYSVPQVLRWTDEGVFLGCFSDDKTDRDISGINTEFSDDNSRDKCSTYCANNGYKYAGLQDGTKCFCGQSYGKFGTVDACYHQCKGNSEENCGGYLASSVYRTNYIGCFNDKEQRSLEGYSFTMTSKAVPSTCIERCGYEGYEFAGVQNGNECYCGNDPNRYGETEFSECNKPCAGDSKLMCGGVFENSVYKTSYRRYGRHQNLGCYKDEVNDRDLDGYCFDLRKQDKEHCVEKCSIKGFQYAGIQEGSMCYCSREYGKHASAPKVDCNMSCPSGYGNECGGVLRNSVYRTFYLGCFEDKENARALNYSYTGDKTMTVMDCVYHCESTDTDHGNLFAGIQNGNECYCGNDYSRYSQVPDDECNKYCPGDSEAICGDHLRNSLYLTYLQQIYV